MTRPVLPAVALADPSTAAGAAAVALPGLSGLAPDALAAWLAERGEPSYRARQVNEAVFGGTVTAIDDIAPLPAALRRDLAAAFRFDTLAETDVRVTDEGLTEKALHTLADGSLIESVLMHYPARRGARERHTLCISSQAGCAVGCPFCATGELGFGRDLQTAEIVDQVRYASRRLIADGPAADQHRVHGHGRAAAQPGPRPGRHRGAQRPAPVRPRRAPHHGLDLGRRAGHPPAHGARPAVHPRRLAARGPGSAA